MISIADELTIVMRRIWQDHGRDGESFDAFLAAHMNPDREQMARRDAEASNREPGHLDDEDGYNCPRCLNRGNIWKAMQVGGHWQSVPERCDCWKVRASIRRMRASGLEGSLRKLSEFVAEEPWQKAMLVAAQRYLAFGVEAGGSLYLGGAVGSGKTMLGSAVCRELLYKGHEVRYMPWVTEAARLKAMAMDDEREEELAVYRRAEYLYIDDLFKPVPGQSGPTAADVRLAYDLINYRYINHLPMIVSSERYINELMDYDEATGSRLAEMCRGHVVNVGRGPGRNWRLRGLGEVV